MCAHISYPFTAPDFIAEQASDAIYLVGDDRPATVVTRWDAAAEHDFQCYGPLPGIHCHYCDWWHDDAAAVRACFLGGACAVCGDATLSSPHGSVCTAGHYSDCA